MPYKYQFVDVNGILCIQMDTTPMSEEPMFCRHTYPTELRTFEFLRNFGETDLSVFRVYSANRYEGGIYSFRIRDGERRWDVQLKDGGKTMPIKTDKIPIPCPKVRSGIQVRWSKWDYRWEKYLKTQGWVSA